MSKKKGRKRDNQERKYWERLGLKLLVLDLKPDTFGEPEVLKVATNEQQERIPPCCQVTNEDIANMAKGFKGAEEAGRKAGYAKMGEPYPNDELIRLKTENDALREDNLTKDDHFGFQEQRWSWLSGRMVYLDQHCQTSGLGKIIPVDKWNEMIRYIDANTPLLKPDYIDPQPEPVFKEGDPVLVRDSFSSYWMGVRFKAHSENGRFLAMFGSWKYCIPFDLNKMGTI